MTPTIKDIIEEFGFDPNKDLGVKVLGWFIVSSIDFEELQAGAQIGDLGVRVSDHISPKNLPGRFVGKSWDYFDGRFVYYYFRPCCS